MLNFELKLFVDMETYTGIFIYLVLYFIASLMLLYRQQRTELEVYTKRLC